MMDHGNTPVNSPKRLRILKAVLLLAFLAVVIRLVEIQVVRSSDLRDRAKRQYEARLDLHAPRGMIVDRNGKVLVSNTVRMTFAADPQVVGDNQNTVVNLFARAFDRPREAYRSKLDDAESRFVILERGVSANDARRLGQKIPAGVLSIEEPDRLYYYGHVAGQVLGMTGVERKGLSGVELQFDRYLRGTDGYVIHQRDAKRRLRPSLDYPRVDPVPGDTVQLTIDVDYQAIVEEELEKGVELAKAEDGVAILVDPRTGEILAMANYPSFNPNRQTGVDQSLLRNRSVTDPVEPGSMFKLVTLSAALDSKAVKPEDKFFAENGSWSVPGGQGRRITDVHRYGMLTFQQAVEVSSNIVFAKVGKRIGPDELYRIAHWYGFGEETGIALPGEAPGQLNKPVHWSGSSIYSLSIGYEVAVTPLQMVMAYAALANNGALMRPYIIKAIVNASQEVVKEGKPEKIRQVIPPETAAAVTHLLEGVVERGTGTMAKVKGLRIAGKTGTARKVVNKKYVEGKYTSSFVGFFPVESPRIVCLVVLNSPRGGSYYGGYVSAPIFQKIAKRVAAQLAVPPTESPEGEVKESRRIVPDVITRKVEDATSLLTDAGFRVETSGEGSYVINQTPAPGSLLAKGSSIRVVTREGMQKNATGVTVVPDVSHLTLRRAVNLLNLQQLEAVISGSGQVVSQSPKAGERVRVGTAVTIRCEPKSISLATM
jgi:cell division protein FtsI (penicillin-binding protein 3)